MRKKVIAGNWKMNNDIPAAEKLIAEMKEQLSSTNTSADVIICPPFISLSKASELIKGSSIKLGAQNMYFEENGAYTGEVSASMLKSAGCEYVILGHSERRSIFKESDEVINKKLLKAIASGLKPIFCVGETLQEREEGIMQTIITNQVTEGLKNISAEALKTIIIAYEPVWAIGTGKVASPAQAQEVHSIIRNLIQKLYSKESADEIIIQYGGSVKPDNAAELLSQPDIDGALVGGACLKADSFIGIVKSV